MRQNLPRNGISHILIYPVAFRRVENLFYSFFELTASYNHAKNGHKAFEFLISTSLSMKQIHYDTVTETMTHLKKNGYTFDFSVLNEEKCFGNEPSLVELSPEDYEIDHFYRFDGYTDPGDEMIVYAISSRKNDVKGIVVNAYGMYADSEASALVERLKTD